MALTSDPMTLTYCALVAPGKSNPHTKFGMPSCPNLFKSYKLQKSCHGQIDRQTDRQTDRQIDSSR